MRRRCYRASCGQLRSRRRIEAVDRRRVAALDGLAFDLQSRRELALFLGQIARQDGKALDLLDPREPLVYRLDVVPNRFADARILGRHRFGIEPETARKARQLLRVERDERDEE